MKSILSLVLPSKVTWRYVSKGRAALGFVDNVLAVKKSGGIAQGVNSFTTADKSTNNDSTTIATRFFTYTGTASGKTLTLPAVGGDIREVIIMNLSNQTVAVAGATNTVVAAAATGNGFNMTTGQATRLVSDGTLWYRLSLS